MKTLVKLFALALASMVLSSQADARSDSRSWEFSVLLDGSPIGYHRFDLQPADNGLELVSEASFDVRVLFINAFRYRHTNREFWEGECLSRIESNTRQNGKRFAVNGTRVEDQFVLQAGGSVDPLGDCIMSFAYWNPRFLQQSQLLNPQSGEYMPVNVESLGRKEFTVRGEQVLASAWRVTAKDTDLTVWYSDNDEWLGLESIAKGGRIIRYELT
ncbi:MAG: DUF6134 family protein [Woeseiaceae bacterium]|nr:DUF6134 family protein [Woeseiaceae bacterium]